MKRFIAIKHNNAFKRGIAKCQQPFLHRLAVSAIYGLLGIGAPILAVSTALSE